MGLCQICEPPYEKPLFGLDCVAKWAQIATGTWEDYHNLKQLLLCRPISLLNIHYIIRNRGGGAVGKSVDPASGRLVVRIPAATDLSRKKTGTDSSTAKHSAIGVSVPGPGR